MKQILQNLYYSISILVGILDEPYLSRINDKVRCFIYEEMRNGGFRLAQSADASCRGLIDVRRDGLRTMHLKPGKDQFMTIYGGFIHFLCVFL